MTAKNYIRIFLIPLMVMISLIIGCGGGGGDDGTSNNPPTADAGEDQTVTEGTIVTLNGFGSDSDGTVSSYSWSQTTGITCTLSDPSAAQPKFTAPEVEDTTTLIFSLIVTDNSGASSSADTVTITINPNENESPTADAGKDQTVTEGAIVTLNGFGSDSDGTVSSYSWSQTTGITCTLSDPSAAQPKFTAPEVEDTTTLIFSLIVTDNSGASSSADTVTITINTIFIAACGTDFNGISEASEFDEKVGIHPIVLLSNGIRHEFNDDFPIDWVPDLVNDTVLFACMGSEEKDLIKTCEYGTYDIFDQFHPADIYVKRYRRFVEIKILVAKTGDLIGTEKIYGATPDSCPSETKYSQWLYGARVTSEDIEKALSKYVNGIIIKGFDSPGPKPRGLAFDGTYLWCSDSFDGKIYKLDTNGNIVDSFDAPRTSIQGLAFDGIYLWVSVDYYSENEKYGIYKLDTNGNILDSFGIGSIDPDELAFDGAYLWCVDANYNDKIYRLDTNGNVLDSFDAPSTLAFGLAFDGTYLWTTNSGFTNKIIIYKLDTIGNVIDSFEVSGIDIRGLAFDGTYLWCSDDKDDKIYKLPIILD